MMMTTVGTAGGIYHLRGGDIRGIILGNSDLSQSSSGKSRGLKISESFLPSLFGSGSMRHLLEVKRDRLHVCLLSLKRVCVLAESGRISMDDYVIFHLLEERTII